MTSYEVETYKDAPSEVSGTIVSCAEGVEEWEVRWIVCSKRSPISEPRLKVLRLLPEVRAVVAATSLKKRTIDGMTLVDGVHSFLLVSSFAVAWLKSLQKSFLCFFTLFHLKVSKKQQALLTTGNPSKSIACDYDIFFLSNTLNKFGWYLSEYECPEIWIFYEKNSWNDITVEERKLSVRQLHQLIDACYILKRYINTSLFEASA